MIWLATPSKAAAGWLVSKVGVCGLGGGGLFPYYFSRVKVCAHAGGLKEQMTCNYWIVIN